MNFIWQNGKTPAKMFADVDLSNEFYLTEWKNSWKKIADVDLSDEFYLTEWKNSWKIIADVDQIYEFYLTEWKNSSKTIADVDLSDEFYLTEWKNSWKILCGCWSELWISFERTEKFLKNFCGCWSEWWILFDRMEKLLQKYLRMLIWVMNFIWQNGKTPEKIIADVDLSDEFHLTEWKNSWKNNCGGWSELWILFDRMEKLLENNCGCWSECWIFFDRMEKLLQKYLRMLIWVMNFIWHNGKTPEK